MMSDFVEAYFIDEYMFRYTEVMMKQEVFDLSRFDEYREGNRLEVKKANGGLPNSLWDTYSSFSNCNGGVIILGVKERADGTFRRDHEGDYHCSEAEVRGMLRDQAERSTDSRILVNMDTDIFYHDTVKSFRSRHTAVNPDHVWHKLDDIDYLERVGAASVSDVDGKLHPTVAGLLMFGEEYKIRQEYPEYFLDYREMLDPSIRWTDRLESSSGEWSGNLLDFFFQMERKLFRDLKKPFMLDGITRIDETPVHKAIREALANCIANADFSFARGIVIIKNPLSITIENPGSIITGKAQMLKGGVSDPRNKSIIKMFNLIRIGERAGSGVPDIFSVWNDEGWTQPIVEEQYKPDRTILTLAFSEKQADCQKNKHIAEKTSEKTEITSDKAGKTSGKAGKTSDKVAETSGKTGKTSDKAGKTSGKAGKTSDKDGKTSDKVAETSGIAGKTSDKDRKTSGKEKKQAENRKRKTSDNKQAIIDFIYQHGVSKTHDIADAIGLSQPRVRVLLSELTAEGLIVPQGAGKARVYIPKE